MYNKKLFVPYEKYSDLSLSYERHFIPYVRTAFRIFLPHGLHNWLIIAQYKSRSGYYDSEGVEE